MSQAHQVFVHVLCLRTIQEEHQLSALYTDCHRSTGLTNRHAKSRAAQLTRPMKLTIHPWPPEMHDAWSICAAGQRQAGGHQSRGELRPGDTPQAAAAAAAAATAAAARAATVGGPTAGPLPHPPTQRTTCMYWCSAYVSQQVALRAQTSPTVPGFWQNSSHPAGAGHPSRRWMKELTYCSRAQGPGACLVRPPRAGRQGRWRSGGRKCVSGRRPGGGCRTCAARARPPSPGPPPPVHLPLADGALPDVAGPGEDKVVPHHRVKLCAREVGVDVAEPGHAPPPPQGLGDVGLVLALAEGAHQGGGPRLGELDQRKLVPAVQPGRGGRPQASAAKAAAAAAPRAARTPR